MRTSLQEVVKYQLQNEDVSIDMNALVGNHISLRYLERQQCASCNKFVKKLFAQGFCYDCFMNSPQAAPCIINPELCEGHLGKGRDVEWEQKHHVQPHVVYLAVASALKVGVTRESQVPTRWIDQGASFAIKLAEVPYRQLAGEIEVALKGTFTDKTNWRSMLKNEIGDFDLIEEKWQCEELLPADLAEYMTEDDEIVEINYPVEHFPEKVKSISFEKTPEIEGKLLGIKGQYILLDHDRVMNIRKYEGFYVDFQT
jgi:hypothetical protein